MPSRSGWQILVDGFMHRAGWQGEPVTVTMEPHGFSFVPLVWAGWPQVDGAGQVGTRLLTHRWKPGIIVYRTECFRVSNPSDTTRPELIVKSITQAVADPSGHLELQVEPFTVPTVSGSMVQPVGQVRDRLVVGGDSLAPSLGT